MNLRDDLAGVLAGDPRYTIQAYDFIFEALEYTKSLAARDNARSRGRSRPSAPRHVTGRELCEGARRLAVENFGMLALTVLNSWGVKSTSDFGNLVYNLIEHGDLEKTANDSRSDFDGVFDFEQAFRREFVLALDQVA